MTILISYIWYILGLLQGCLITLVLESLVRNMSRRRLKSKKGLLEGENERLKK